MSHDLRVWAQPTGHAPATFDEAARAMLTLEGARPGVNPKFIALAERLARKDTGLSDGAWLSQLKTQAQTCVQAVWAFELPVEQPIRALRLVVEQANALGLTVLDDQLGVVFTPSGIFPPAWAPQWAALLAELDQPSAEWTLPEARDWLAQGAGQMLPPLGFAGPSLPKPTAFEFVRETRAGQQMVGGYFRMLSDRVACALRPSFGSHLIAAVRDAAFSSALGDLPLAKQFTISFGSFHGRVSFDMPLEHEQQAHEILTMVKDPSLDILHIARTDEGIARLVDGSEAFAYQGMGPADFKSLAEQFWHFSQIPSLIISWASGSPRFAEIEAYVRALSDKFEPERRQNEQHKFDVLVGHLKAHVPRHLPD